LSFDERDSAPYVPKCMVVDPNFDWARERQWHPVPWDRTIVYETHVRGYTKLHPKVPDHQRGTYCGLAVNEVVSYIKSLGVTSVELLPLHTFVNDKFLFDKGLTNYWGYNSIGFFAPDPRYASDLSKTLQSSRNGGALHDAASKFIDVVTTTPPRATSSGRRFPSRASTTPRTTGSCPRTGAITSTTPAPAIR
jgi:glycogen operon protein